MKRVLMFMVGLLAIMATVNSALAFDSFTGTLVNATTFTTADNVDRNLQIHRDLNGNVFMIGHNLSTQCSIGHMSNTATHDFVFDEFTNGTNRITDCNNPNFAVGVGYSQFYMMHGQNNLINTSWNIPNFDVISSEYNRFDVNCPLIDWTGATTDNSRDIVVTNSFITTLTADKTHLRMCRIVLETEQPSTFPTNTIADMHEISEIDKGINRIGTYNFTHIMIIDLDLTNNLSQMVRCDAPFVGSGDVIDAYGSNGWYYTLDATKDKIHVFNGENCDHEATVTLDTLECSAFESKSSVDGFVVDSNGIHCVDDLIGGAYKRVKRYSVTWDYPTTAPLEIEENETFTANATEGEYIVNEITGATILNLDMKNPFFNCSASAGSQYDYANSSSQVCFLAILGKWTGLNVRNFLLNNIVILLAIVVMIAIIGLMLSGKMM